MWMGRLNSLMIRMVLTWLIMGIFLQPGITGLARHSRQTQSDGAILARVSNLETSLISIQKLLSSRPAFDDKLVKSYASEIIANSLESIQDGLISEKQQRLQLENVASSIKDIINKQDARIRDLEQACLTKLTSPSAPGKQSNCNEDETPNQHISRSFKAQDCWDLKTKYNISKDGVYYLVTPDGHGRSLRCDMTTDGGGWTVFQRRGDGSVTFNLDWVKHKSLFGSLTGEYWMGNDFLYESTRTVTQTLRLDICDWDGTTRWAQYRVFSVGAPQDKYPLHFDGYTGTAGNALYAGKNSQYNHNGMAFSTGDQDNDKNSSENCAAGFSCGWWFNDCFSANLNGVYQPKHSSDKSWNGIQWSTWKSKHSFKGSEMKQRPSAAIPSTTLQPFSCPVI